MSITVETLTGDALYAALPMLARLRAVVFRDWPYLYESGDPTGATTYESAYARRYAASGSAALILARDGDEPVGAATCLPLLEEGEREAAPFRAHGLDPGQFFYFGESVLLPAYRGQGIGVAFFAQREAQALRVGGFDYSCFCSVIRPADHPARPRDAVPLDAFWRKRGYAPYPDIICHMRWREVDGAEHDNALSFWVKSLSGRPLP